MKWLMVKATLASSEKKVCGCRANNMEQFVRKGSSPRVQVHVPVEREQAPEWQVALDQQAGQEH